LGERRGRRFGHAIAEGDGISLVVEVNGAESARAAEADGARALVVEGGIDAVRAASELPILSTVSSPEDAARSGADACVVAAGDLSRDGGDPLHAALALGLDCVVSVDDDEELKRVLDEHDPEILLLDGDLERALELLSDVPVGKLAIARAESVTEAEIAELERRGVDAVIVPARSVGALAGDARPG
jgi:indole-3-glycerol phosphate synthase